MTPPNVLPSQSIIDLDAINPGANPPQAQQKSKEAEAPMLCEVVLHPKAAELLQILQPTVVIQQHPYFQNRASVTAEQQQQALQAELRGDQYREKQDYANAANQYRWAVQTLRDPEKKDLLLKYAQIASRSGDFAMMQDAADMYSALVAQAPCYDELRNERGSFNQQFAMVVEQVSGNIPADQRANFQNLLMQTTLTGKLDDNFLLSRGALQATKDLAELLKDFKKSAPEKKQETLKKVEPILKDFLDMRFQENQDLEYRVAFMTRPSSQMRQALGYLIHLTEGDKDPTVRNYHRTFKGMYQQFFGELVEAYRIFQELAQEGNKEFGGGDAAKGKKQATELQARVRKVSENAQKKMMEAMEALQKGEMPTQQGAASDPEAQKAWDALPFSYRWAMGFLSPYETARQQQVQIYKILGSLEAPTEEELKQKLGKDPKSASSEELAKATAKLKEEMAMAKGKERYRFLVGRERALIREILPIQAELNALLAAHKEQFKGEAVLPQQVQQVIQAVTGKLQELAQQDIDPNEARSQLKQALAESLKGVEHEGARRLVNAIFDRAGQRAMVFPEALPEQVREALMPQIMASRQFMDGLEASQLRVANRKALAVWSAFMDETQKDRMPGAFRGFFSGLAGFFRATPWLGDDKTHWDDIFEAYQHDLNLYQEVGNRVRSGEAVSAEEALQQISDQGLPWEERNKRIDEDNKDKAEEVKKFHENFKWKKEDAEAVEARAKELINEKDEDFDLMDVFRYVNRPDPDPKVGEALLKMALEMEKEGDYPKTAETIYQLVADTTADDKLKKAAEGALKALRDKDAKPAPAPSASASAGK